MEKRSVLITGATAGIGKEAALALHRDGWRVFATGRKADALAALAAEGLETVRLDVNDPASVEACVREVMERTGGEGVDVVVNNAGYGQMGPLLDVSDDQLRQVFETNVFGLMRVTRAFVGPMLRRRSGRVINVSSGGGRMSFPLAGAYTATKFAVEAMSDALRWELAPFGIDVVVIEPGPIRTNFADTAAKSVDERPDDSPYAPVYRQIEAIKAQADKMSAPPSIVVRAIRRAATARRPAARYTAPGYLGVGLWLANFVPTCVVDFFMERGAGLTRKKLQAV
jgi:NAD(P)-dependent dehydrogenase (short-subunit alcohol dehydrogenase family)